MEVPPRQDLINKFSTSVRVCNQVFCAEQQRQCTYNATLRHVRETIVAVEKQ